MAQQLARWVCLTVSRSGKPKGTAWSTRETLRPAWTEKAVAEIWWRFSQDHAVAGRMDRCWIAGRRDEPPSKQSRPAL